MNAFDGSQKGFQIKTREPNNTEAESVIIGACLISAQAYGRLQLQLDDEDFYEPLYADVWRIMREMTVGGGYPDLVTVIPRLKDQKVGDVSAANHLKLLAESYSREYTPTDEALDAYVIELRHCTAQRTFRRRLTELSERAYENDANLAEIAANAHADIDAITTRANATAKRTCRPIIDFIDAALARFDDENAAAGISTGLKAIDAITGGLYRGEVSIVGGRPSMGKTILGVQIGLNAARKNIGTLIVSLEMNGERLGERVMSNVSAIPYTFLRTDKLVNQEDRKIVPEDREKLSSARDELANVPLLVEEKAGLTVAEIGALAARARAYFAKRNVELGLVMIDYLGLVNPTEKYKGQRVNEVGEISAGLKAIAKNLDIHVMALHQLNRSVDDRDDKRPLLRDLRDSGTIEQDADLVFFVFREAYYLERQSFDDPEREEARVFRLNQVRKQVEIITAKNRAGSAGPLTLGIDVALARVSDI